MSGKEKMMQAVVFRDGAIRVKGTPLPEPGYGEVLLQVEAAALCATDLKIWQRGHRNIPPGSEAILGHEVVGRVAAVGPGADPSLVGKRVVVPPNVGCSLCPACLAGWDSYCPDYKAYGIGLAGGLAEYMLVTAPSVLRGNLVEVPEHIPAETAVLAEPLACCYRGLQECGLAAGEAVLVMGGGPMGILSIIAARAMGASTIIAADPLESRRERSLSFGADHALDPQLGDFTSAVGALTGGWGVDVVMVTAPFSRAQAAGIATAAVGGRINLFAGLPPDDAFDNFPANQVHYRGLKILGTTGTTPREMRAVVRLMAAGRLEKLEKAVTAVYPLAEAERAFAEAQGGEGIKVVVVPGKGEID